MNRWVVLSTVVIVGCAAPRADFRYDRDAASVPSRVSFANTSENAVSYVWDFGDGTTSADTSPHHRYIRSGTYTVRLRAMKGEKMDTHTEEITVEPRETCLVEIATEHGSMLVELYDETPLHRDNFLKLVEEGYYNGLLFHRVIDGFMIQGGDPDSRGADRGQLLGSGSPGYQIDAEFNENLVHVKGTLAAARTGDAVNPERKSSGSQFYIVHGSPVNPDVLEMVEMRNNVAYTPEQRKAYAEIGGTPQLDMQYTVFGRVIDGLHVIDKIAAVSTDGRDRPEEDVEMQLHIVR